MSKKKMQTVETVENLLNDPLFRDNHPNFLVRKCKLTFVIA